MTQITAQSVRMLREKTGLGMMDCKKALQETGGDSEKAIEYLRKQGLSAVEKRAGRDASEGLIQAYIHQGSRLGVLLEVNCETDFVARTGDFQEFAKDVAMHIAASQPLAVDREGIPADAVEKERAIFLEQAKNEGKPEHIAEKIVDGRMEKFYQENCLMEQVFVKNPDQTIGELVTEITAKIGEKITVRRFERFVLGEDA
ncbi:MAG: translation elongation factor Ts [Gemmatimonadetes bacterium]|nr:translation elongation factor Ts [Gemmatimonadota bacterium]MDE2743936.1 translation elongation factor Ts [Gemmatimonadota bacterium]MXW77641.1 translation elongation factor Ts [Gemmatimonadota bacterium]MYC72248.1 translation elongation factor Ts [Gemmatimonadota bacterium]MYI61596.1 translation elongation factor Ts [Gemmatimonadota bacterium]